MKKYNILLNIYVLIKIGLTFFVPNICVFGVFTIPFSVSFGLNEGMYKYIARFLILFSFLWILFFIMNIVPNLIINRISRIGIMLLSILEIICLSVSIIYGVIALGDFEKMFLVVFLRTLAIAVNILCILYCIKRIVRK
ncbi:MAG: hypothetical protein IJH32_08065 [Ruminococcus sp.]|nr:hypothetical protein [Ruminococcus sp.]